MPAEGRLRPVWAEIDLTAIRHNIEVLAALASPAAVTAVVKADAYGHSAPEVARAAVRAGAVSLAVALVDEGLELRESGIGAPVLVLTEPAGEAMDAAISAGLTPTLYTAGGVAAARASALALGAGSRRAPAEVEVKVDTGMHRVGAAPSELASIVAAVVEAPELSFAGLWTHLAVSDEPASEFTRDQLTRFAACERDLRRRGLPPPRRRHAANSAGAIAWPESRMDLVRCGLACYGYVPPGVVSLLTRELETLGLSRLRPALALKAHVTLVRRYPAGERLSYGLRRSLPSESLVATVPIGYADGLPRAYFEAGGEVLIGGRRRALAGMVTMDQIVVACPDAPTVSPGDEVVLLGRQGEEEITADEWAARLDTISYEVLSRIGPRVPRRFHPGERDPRTPPRP